MQTCQFKCWQGSRKKKKWSNGQEFANAGEMLVDFHVLIFITLSVFMSHPYCVKRSRCARARSPWVFVSLFVRSVILCSLVPPVTSSSTVFSVCWWQFLLKGRASSWVHPVFAQSFLSRQPPYFHVIADLKILLSLYVMCYYRGKHVYLFQTAQNSCFKCLAHTITSECVLSEHMRDVPWNIWVTEETELSLKVILLMQEALHFLEYAARIWRP